MQQIYQSVKKSIPFTKKINKDFLYHNMQISSETMTVHLHKLSVHKSYNNFMKDFAAGFVLYASIIVSYF